MRRLQTVIVAAGAFGVAIALPAQRPTVSAPPALIVFITVDQMRPDYLDVYQSQFTGGLARLLKGGAFFTNAFQDHGVTETAPGHASTLSGRFPRSTGIVANDAGVLDPQAPLIGARGDPASPFRFRGTTLIDWIRLHDPRARALSVSRKDRGAILPLGRARQQVYWYATNGTFTTSSYYADTLPTWVQQFNARRIPQSYAGKQWTLLLPEKAYAEADTVPEESSGEDYVFPHPFPASEAQAAASFAAYPMMDELTLQLALRGLSSLELGGTPGRTDLLAVSLSTTDAVGHRFGPDSRELHDQIVRLDRYLGAFVDSLYKLRDSSTIVFALTADHGVAPLPEAEVKSRYRASAGGFADITPAIRTLYEGLQRAGVDSAGYNEDSGVLYLDPDALARARLNRDSVARSYATQVSRIQGIARADLFSDLARRDTTKDAISRRWLHMFPSDLPVAVVVTLAPFWYWSGVPIATHGTPNDYDAHVPILLYGPRIRDGKYGEMARVVDLAPTLAALAGVKPMERLDGHVLTSAIR